MFYLIITILQNVIIFTVFKLFPEYKINTLQAIVANYCVCVVTGIVFIGHSPFHAEIVHANWFPWAIFMGSGFIPLFCLMAYSTRIGGITTATIANKLSLVIPVFFAIILYHEQISFLKIMGILLAFPAVYYTTRVRDGDNKPQGLFWPAILFVGSGLLDTLVTYIQYRFLNSADIEAVYSICVFATAAIIGLVIIAVLLLLKKTTLHWRNLIAGVCLGVPNFFSIYYLIRMLSSNFLHKSAAIPVLNIGVVFACAFTAILLFKEKVNRLRIIGLVLSIMAILFIAFGDK